MKGAVDRLHGELLESSKGIDVLLPMKGVQKFEDLSLRQVGEQLLLQVVQEGRDPFTFQIPLPGAVDAENLHAAFFQGELHIHLPWRVAGEESRPDPGVPPQ